MPQPWSRLIVEPSADVRQAARLVAMIDTDDCVNRLHQLVQQDLSNVSRLFGALPNFDFILVLWDRHKFEVIQRAGPNRRRVLTLLRRQSPLRRQPVRSDEQTYDAVGDVVQIVTEALDQREDVSFALVFQILGDRIPEFVHSGLSRQEAWDAVRLSLPEEDRQKVPVKPPPSLEELAGSLTEPAAPTEWLSEGTITSGVRWHEYQRCSLSLHRSGGGIEHGPSFATADTFRSGEMTRRPVGRSTSCVACSSSMKHFCHLQQCLTS